MVGANFAWDGTEFWESPLAKAMHAFDGVNSRWERFRLSFYRRNVNT